MKNLLLITLSFPYDVGCEDTFLLNEIPFYREKFNKVIILPCQLSRSKAEIDSEIIIDKSFITYTKTSKKYRVSYNLFHFFRLIFNEPIKNFRKLTSYRDIKNLISNYFLIVSYFNFLASFFSNKKDEEWLIYTYWFTPMTTAAALFASKNKNIKIVTRAHGIDLYEFRNNNYIPFRRQTIGLLTKYFFISESGKRYSEQQYPEFKSKYLIFGLGVKDFNFHAQKSEPGVLKMVSCSSVDKNKRVDLIILALEKLISENSNVKIEWNHFGTGPLFEKILDLAKTRLLNQINFYFHGSVPNDLIIEFYKTNKVDLFITTSASEGKPFSIMEALCCSIPIIATNVGGIPEIVNSENGILLNEKPEIEEIKNALLWFVEHSDLVDLKKKAARLMWETNCNSSNNFSTFVNYLSKL